MAKRLTTGEKREKALIAIINKMFEIAGHEVNFDDVKGRKDEWYKEWTMTIEQSDEWRAWGEAYLKKNLRMYEKPAKIEMAWISLMYGLKFSPNPWKSED